MTFSARILESWVMTSSDGTDGHPRKYASYPTKWQTYVREHQVISVEDFLYRSAGLAAETFGLSDRGRIEPGYSADIVVFDPERFAAVADFSDWNALSNGVIHLLVNGEVVIEDQTYNGKLAGVVLSGNP